MALRVPSVLLSGIPRFAWSLVSPTSLAKDPDILFDVIGEGDALSPAEFLRQMPSRRLTLFGETHHQPACLAMQLALLKRAIDSGRTTVLVLEHFSVLHNAALAEYIDKSKDEAAAGSALISSYSQSTEGFDLSFYLPLLRTARQGGIRIFGGFPPREWAKFIMRENVGQLRQRLAASDVTFDRWDDIRPNPEHKALIQSMISGQPISVTEETSAVGIDDVKGLAAAQCLKDAVFAWTIDSHLAQGSDVLGICGSGHLEYDFGVIERVRGIGRQDLFSIVAKSQESEIWKGSAWETDTTSLRLGDAVYLYEAV